MLHIPSEIIDNPSKENYTKLLRFLKSKKRGVRLEAIEVFTLEKKFRKHLTKENIFFLIYDNNSQIVTEAIKLLAFTLNVKDIKIFKRILEILNIKKKLKFISKTNELLITDLINVLYDYIDFLKPEDINFLLKNPSGLVRSYAIGLYGNIKNTKEDIINLLENERSSQCKLAAYTALYQQGDVQYLEKIIKLMLSTKQFLIRAACIDTLFNHVNKEIFQVILNSFLSLNKIENTRFVKSILKEKILLLKKQKIERFSRVR